MQQALSKLVLTALATVALASCQRDSAKPADSRRTAGAGDDSAKAHVDRAVPPIVDDLQRRTFDYFWETTNPKNGLVPDRWPTTRSRQHRGGRLRAHRLRRRRRARLDHARPGDRTHAGDAALLRRTRRRGPTPSGTSRLQGLLLPLPRHGTGRALRDQRALDGRHHAAAGRRAVRADLLRPRRSAREGNPRHRRAHLSRASTGLVRRRARR